MCLAGGIKGGTDDNGGDTIDDEHDGVPSDKYDKKALIDNALFRKEQDRVPEDATRNWHLDMYVMSAPLYSSLTNSYVDYIIIEQHAFFTSCITP